MQRKTITRTLRIVLGAAFGLNLMTGAAFAAPSSTPSADHRPVVEANASQAKYECSDSHHSDTGNGANNSDGYQSTCDETDFGGNGQEDGPGKQTGTPCAGCVGNADDKNPPGQFPDGSDANSGYECDGRDRPAHNQNGNGNHGIGDENPAHTGCQSTTEPPAPTETCPDGSAMPTSDLDGSGTIDDADCTWEPPVTTCPDGTPMTDTDGNGVITPADCNTVDSDDDDDVDPTCPDGSPMTDTDGNGVVTPADCNTTVDSDDDDTTTVTDTTPEVTITVVSPIVEVAGPAVPAVPVVAAPAAPAVAVLAALDVQPEQVVAAPAAPVRPSEVLGVQVERADLARTGLPTDVLMLLAGALLFVGALLVRTGRPAKR